MSDGENYNRQGDWGSKPWRRSSTSPLHNPMVSTKSRSETWAFVLTKPQLLQGDPAVHAQAVGDVRKG